MPPRRWLRQVTLIAGSTVAALVLSELAVRWIWSPPWAGYPLGLFVADAHAGYRLANEFTATQQLGDLQVEIVTNARGYRSPEIGPKRAGVCRILCVGDSLTFGHGVRMEEAFPRVLEDVLRARGQDAEVINAAVPGYGTANACAVVEQDAPLLEPDVVVFAFYVGNDFRDNDAARFGRLTANAGGIVAVHEGGEGLWARTRATLSAHSRLAQMLFFELARSQAPTGIAAIADACSRIDWDPGFSFAMVRRTWDEDAKRAFAATLVQLDHLAAIAAKAPWRLVFTLVGGPFQYDEGVWQLVVNGCQLDPSAFDLDRPQRELTAWAKDHGVEVLDLLPAFRAWTAANSGERLYTDVHLTPRGHLLAAEQLATRLGQ